MEKQLSRSVKSNHVLSGELKDGKFVIIFSKVMFISTALPQALNSPPCVQDQVDVDDVDDGNHDQFKQCKIRIQ